MHFINSTNIKLVLDNYTDLYRDMPNCRYIDMFKFMLKQSTKLWTFPYVPHGVLYLCLYAPLVWCPCHLDIPDLVFSFYQLFHLRIFGWKFYTQHSSDHSLLRSLYFLYLNPALWLAAVVTDRVREAHQNKSAPPMMLFPGYVLKTLLLLYIFSDKFKWLCCHIYNVLSGHWYLIIVSHDFFLTSILQIRSLYVGLFLLFL